MLKQLSQRKIKENWEKYKPHIETAFERLIKEQEYTDSEMEELYNGVFERLMNPFNHIMQLWIEGEEDYVVLTQLQVCEFTRRQTLILFSSTRTKDVDKEKVSQRYYEAYKTISKFARDNYCVGMFCISDLDYFAELAEKSKEWTNVITRYQFYFPLTNN